MSPTKDDPRRTVRLSQELDDKLVAASKRDGLSIGLHIRTALENYLTSPQPILTTPAVRDCFEAVVGAEVEQTFACPFPGCGYRAKSAAAVCAAHGRKVVPV